MAKEKIAELLQYSYDRIAAMTSPVPPEQQPLNEYLALKESWFFQWGQSSYGAFLRIAFLIWASWWIVSGPVAAVSYAPHRFLAKFVCAGAAGATLGLFFILLRLFLGWAYIHDRLMSASVFYEESGWYDGQKWQKTTVELAQDRLIARYEVSPILQKLRSVGAGLVMLLALTIGVTIAP